MTAIRMSTGEIVKATLMNIMGNDVYFINDNEGGYSCSIPQFKMFFRVIKTN